MSCLFASGGLSIGASASVLPMHESFPGVSCSLNCLFLPKCNPHVLKHRFYYYYLGPAKPADEEIMAPEKTQLVTHSSQEERGAHCPLQSHTGKHQGLSGDGGVRGGVRNSLYCGLTRKNGRSRVNWLGTGYCK